MTLNKDINYIVSGLERSGTSMMMQILHTGGVPMAFDNESRPPDTNNPKGYFELEGGKIISRLMDGSFPMKDFAGRFIKITAYGLKFLPEGKYRIIYSERNIEEILDSMEKMARITDENRADTRTTFVKLNEMIKKSIQDRADVDVLFVNYNAILRDPETELKKISDFLGAGFDLQGMKAAVDKSLYRNSRE